tara:strand:+ start:335 stop:808 length:474 start_codon:yes stop_codon:yes gene_type:complete
MNVIKSIIITPLLILFLISSCSYQKMNSVDQKKFNIKEFEVTGDSRESFVIKKKIQRFSNKNSENKIKILIELKKNKSIKEKNIQNKVTKYNVSLSANVKIIELDTNKEIKRSFAANEIYNVEDSYSNTINNSKEANNSLIERIVDEILDQLRIYYS